MYELRYFLHVDSGAIIIGLTDNPTLPQGLLNVGVPCICTCLHGNNSQGKVVYETTTIGWVRPFVTLIQSNCRIL